ncbi:MAG: hypothetical protein M3290_13965, partial [Actinomycetota bacterium]|nr:hypothetical protein [Actinomycetota bacterium]
DKIKQAAQDVATQAKSATAQAQSKIEQGQTRKKMDETAKKLGYLVYRERAFGEPASDADQLVSEITALQQQLDAEAAATDGGDTQQAPQAPVASGAEVTPPPTSASEPTGGDFKL